MSEHDDEGNCYRIGKYPTEYDFPNSSNDSFTKIDQFEALQWKDAITTVNDLTNPFLQNASSNKQNRIKYHLWACNLTHRHTFSRNSHNWDLIISYNNIKYECNILIQMMLNCETDVYG